MEPLGKAVELTRVRRRVGQLGKDRKTLAQRERNDRQVEPVDEAVGDEAASESRSALRGHRFSVLRLQLGDPRDQIAARHIGLRPAFSAGLKGVGLVLNHAGRFKGSLESDH